MVTPSFFFWISITLVKICFSRIFSKPRKNTIELVGTVLNKSLPLFRPTKWHYSIIPTNYFYSIIPLHPRSSMQPSQNCLRFLHLSLRQDLNDTFKRQAQKQAKSDYERTVQDWHRMNLAELKNLPPSPRYHMKKAIVSYLGTSRGSSRALVPLTEELNATTPAAISQP